MLNMLWMIFFRVINCLLFFYSKDTAKSLIEDDTFYTMSLLKKGASHGYAPRSLLCCICSTLLSKNSSSFHVFSCGHASHLQCELLEQETSSSRGLSSGCPVCLPKKNNKKSKKKSALTENGLVSSLRSKPLPTQGSTLYPQENDALDISYGLHQLSRVDLYFFLLFFLLSLIVAW